MALDGKPKFDLTQFSCPIKGDAMLLLTRAVFPARDWQQVTPESQGLDAARLQAAVDYLRENTGPDGVKEVVIVRNGYLVWKGSSITKVHGVWSATKSFTSTVLGLLADDGKATPDTRARDIVPALATAYPDVTLRHFTTMTSGYRAMKDEPRGTYAAGGYNNNGMFVIPEWNMVIVRLGLDESQRPITDAVYSSFIEKVGQAIADGPGAHPK